MYSPTKDKHHEQVLFLSNLKNIVNQYSDKALIIGGDFNTYLDVSLDKMGGTAEKQSTYSEKLKSFCEEFSLVDIFRIRNKNQIFTRREFTKSGFIQSRLDYWFTSIQLEYLIQNTSIKAGNSSDHGIISLDLELVDTQKRGKGLWKFNNNLLTDPDYVRLIKTLITDIKTNVNLENKNTLWDFVKCDIRSHTILYTCKKAKQEAITEKELASKLNKLEQNVKMNGDENLTEYLELKREWEKFLKKRHLGVITRSKAKWVEEGEKNTKYFLNLEKRNFNIKYIRKLITKDNEEITSLKDIINEEMQFYQDLYTSKSKDEGNISEGQNFFEQNRIPQLPNLEKIMCDEVLTLEEMTKALKLLPNNKSPGSDGFTTNFYKFFWIDIKDFLFDSFRYSFIHGTLSNDQKLGVLNLIPKTQKDLQYLSNWRPVSLLQTDYKILTKTLALRLQKVLPKIISTDQVGYIPNRYIGENIRIIQDIMTYSQLHKIPGYIALIDFQKAFDSIEWGFMFKCLLHFNFGENFIRWIKLLYTDISSCVGNNGFYSRGIRQGCPISALLFLLVAE